MVRKPQVGDIWLDLTEQEDYGSPCVLVVVDRVPSRSVPGEFSWIVIMTNQRGEIESKRMADSLMKYWYQLGTDIGGKVILLNRSE